MMHFSFSSAEHRLLHFENAAPAPEAQEKLKVAGDTPTDAMATQLAGKNIKEASASSKSAAARVGGRVEELNKLGPQTAPQNAQQQQEWPADADQRLAEGRRILQGYNPSRAWSREETVNQLRIAGIQEPRDLDAARAGREQLQPTGTGMSRLAGIGQQLNLFFRMMKDPNGKESEWGQFTASINTYNNANPYTAFLQLRGAAVGEELVVTLKPSDQLKTRMQTFQKSLTQANVRFRVDAGTIIVENATPGAVNQVISALNTIRDPRDVQAAQKTAKEGAGKGAAETANKARQDAQEVVNRVQGKLTILGTNDPALRKRISVKIVELEPAIKNTSSATDVLETRTKELRVLEQELDKVIGSSTSLETVSKAGNDAITEMEAAMKLIPMPAAIRKQLEERISAVRTAIGTNPEPEAIRKATMALMEFRASLVKMIPEERMKIVEQNAKARLEGGQKLINSAAGIMGNGLGQANVQADGANQWYIDLNGGGNLKVRWNAAEKTWEAGQANDINDDEIAWHSVDLGEWSAEGDTFFNASGRLQANRMVMRLKTMQERLIVDPDRITF